MKFSEYIQIHSILSDLLAPHKRAFQQELRADSINVFFENSYK